MVSNLPARRHMGGLATRGENPFTELRRRMDTLFDRFFTGWPLGEEVGQEEGLRFWDFEVDEQEKEIIVKAEMPGFEPNELDVQFTGDVLTVKAEHKETKDGKELYRRYRRSVTLPAGVDAENVQATYRNGVLEMHMPRTEEAKPRRIQIQSEQVGTGHIATQKQE